jgi:predicted enzyme related to lactoylglutathione lyase
MVYRYFNCLVAFSALVSTLGWAQQAHGQPAEEKSTIKIKLSSLLVDDQEQALKFYTENLGFVKKTEIKMGKYRWLTVVSPAGSEEIELALEPTAFAPAKTYQKALYDAGIPLTAFPVDDIQKEFKRMKKLGVKFRGEPKKTGPEISVLFEDTCGNLIQLYQP